MRVKYFNHKAELHIVDEKVLIIAETDFINNAHTKIYEVIEECMNVDDAKIVTENANITDLLDGSYGSSETGTRKELLGSDSLPDKYKQYIQNDIDLFIKEAKRLED